MFNIAPTTAKTITLNDVILRGGDVRGQTSPANYGGVVCSYTGNSSYNLTLNLNRCVVTDGKAVLGGGIYNYHLLNVNQCTINNNTATNMGGGIYINNGTTNIQVILNSTISYNSPEGIYQLRAVIRIINSTISNNSEKGVYCYGQSPATAFCHVLNCIIINNGLFDFYKSGRSYAYCYYGWTTGVFGVDPLAPNQTGSYTTGDLGSLTNNGGPTPTMALSLSAPAYHTGSCAYYNATDGYYYKGTDNSYYKFINSTASTTGVTAITPTNPEADKITTDQRGATRDATQSMGSYDGVLATAEIDVKQGATAIADGSGTYDFGSQATSTNTDVIFTIENTGTAASTLENFTITGTDAAQFSYQGTNPSTVANGSSVTFTVRFAPTSGGAKTATVSFANQDAVKNPYNFTITGTAVAAPTVTTQAASSITATTATGNGNITATNGANSTIRGMIYWLYTNTDKIKTDAGVTTVSENGSFGTGTFTSSLTSLSANTQYNARAYATSTNGTGYGSRVAFCTLGNVPSAPTLNNATATTLDVTVNANSNPDATEFAIYETTQGKLVQADGSLGVSTVWQTKATWGTKTVTGLASASTYTFEVKARNGENTVTAYGATANGSTSGCYAGKNWTARSATEASYWTSITYGNGLYVAVARIGTNRVMTSTDGITWTARSAAQANQWSSVTYGNGLFVAVSTNGTNRVMSSPDGITWTARTATAANAWRSVTYGNGLFVAVSQEATNAVMTSPDGITWTARTAALANPWTSVTFGNGLFVAVAYSGSQTVMTSPDGITWTARSAAEDNWWISVTYGNGLFVALSSNITDAHQVMTSTNGINWTAHTSSEANDWNSVAYGNSLFVAVSGFGPFSVMTSPDGNTWTSRMISEDNRWCSVTYGNDLFVAVSNNGTNRVMTSDCSAPVVVPTTQASAINFTSLAGTSFTINWTNGNGSNRAVFVKEGIGSITNPGDNTTYTASPNWNVKGTQLGASGYYCVYNGTASTIAITNLSISTQYTVQVFEYNGSAGNEKYYTATATNNPNNSWTLANVPSAPTVNNATASTLDVTVNVNSNPASTEFAIYETTQSKFVQANGTLGASVVWQTAATWGTKTVTGLTTGSTYTFKVKARNGVNTETAYGTTANGTAAQPMQLKFTTNGTSKRIYLPLYGTVNCTVDWGDGSATDNFSTTGNKLHTFATAGTYTVKISGTLTHFGYYDYMNSSGWSGSGYLTEVIDFGNIGLTSLSGAFSDADNLSSVPSAFPATVTDLSYCFYLISQATITNLNLWNVSSVTNVEGMFYYASAFNQNIGNWDVSGVTTMFRMFSRASSFNQPIGNWNASSATDMSDMFRSASAFNQPIGNWNVSSATDMSGMFESASAFNQPIGNWNVGNATTMESMFDYASLFNQDLTNWNVSKVTDLSWMFSGASVFNQNLGSWNIGSVTAMEDMFKGVTLSTANYDAILIAWAAKTLQNDVIFSGGNSKYSCTAVPARAVLTGTPNTWTITDGGPNISITWDGSESPDWNEAANWSGNTVPTETDFVLIPHVTTDPVVNLTPAYPCNCLTIESGAVLTIPAGKALTVNGTLTNNAGITGLVVQSTSSASDGTGALLNGTAGVQGTVERFVSGDYWHLISPSATAGESVANFVLLANGNLVARNGTNYALAPWLESTGKWDYYKVAGSNSGMFGSPAQGFQVMRANGAGSGIGTDVAGSGKLTFKGTLAGADFTIPVTKSLYGWNLIGNPYPCALDVTKFITENTAQLDQSYLAIYVSNIADVDASKGYSPVILADGLKLAPGEGFFVKAKAGGGTISFTTTMKSNVSAAFKAASVDSPTIRLTAEDGNGKLATTLKYEGGATKGLDPGKDAGLFNGSASTFSLFTRLIEDNGVDFTVQVLPANNLESMVVPVGLVAAKGATVTFKATATNLPLGYKVYLEDKETATFTRLDEANSSYTVSLEAATLGTGRFYLHTTEIVSAIDSELHNEFRVVPNPDQQLVRIIGNFDLPATAKVYDMNGKLVATSALTAQIENTIALNNCGTGVYLLKVETDKGTETVKFVWKRK
ncbi:MAG: BspA family leucine-rich repeat surface protein [Mariniphaga sp.]